MATPLFAAERVPLGLKPAESHERRVQPLLIALPSLETNDQSVVEIRILRGRERVIEQTMLIPPAAPAGAVIDVLFTHPEELRQFREDAENLRIVMRADDRVVLDEPFAAVDTRGALLSRRHAIGELREVKQYPKRVGRISADDQYYEPYCMEHCDTQYNSCLQWCDPRGDSCTQCEIWYHDCWIQCPIVCSDLKSDTYETRYTALYYTEYHDSACLLYITSPQGSATWWDDYTMRYRVDTIRTTEYCSGVIVTQVVSSYETDLRCWWYSGDRCYSSWGFVNPYAVCP
jgi:hypothetical protein